MSSILFGARWLQVQERPVWVRLRDFETTRSAHRPDIAFEGAGGAIFRSFLHSWVSYLRVLDGLYGFAECLEGLWYRVTSGFLRGIKAQLLAWIGVFAVSVV